MRRFRVTRFLSLVAILVLALTAVGVAHGQTTPASSPPGSEAEPGPPILQFLLAALALGLILMILMMPTRKSQ